MVKIFSDENREFKNMQAERMETNNLQSRQTQNEVTNISDQIEQLLNTINKQ